MDYYLFVARSVTHAQHMANALREAGVSSRIRRAGAEISERGCGYTLEISKRSFARAREACNASGVRPTRVLRVSGGMKQEVMI